MSLFLIMAAAAASVVEVTIPGPSGSLGAALTDPAASAPLVILVPGSGPTDRDGNNPLGVKGGAYRQLGDALASKGIATLRIDKRGLFSSKGAIEDPNAVHIADYAADVHGWARFARSRGKPCAWIAGHSEGGLIALAAAQDPAGLCGLILIAAPGRPLGQLLRDQLRPQLPPEMMVPVDAAIVRLEAGQPVDPATVPAPLRPLFAPQLQGYLGEMARADPARLAAAHKLPMLIIQGRADLQVSVADAQKLANARPDATLALLDGVNHVLKQVGDDKAANQASYGDEKMPIDPAVAEAIAAFVKTKR